MGIVNFLYTVVASNCNCCPLSSKTAAISAAIYSISVSVVLILVYIIKMVQNTDKEDIRSVYYGIQIAIGAVIVIHTMVIFTSSLLLVGIHKYRCNYVFLWIISSICFLALETVATVYWNVLRDHAEKDFSSVAAVEIALFLVRTILNIFCILTVIWFYQELRSGSIKFAYNGHDPAEEVML